jgi:hypothetical protein
MRVVGVPVSGDVTPRIDKVAGNLHGWLRFLYPIQRRRIKTLALVVASVVASPACTCRIANDRATAPSGGRRAGLSRFSASGRTAIGQLVRVGSALAQRRADCAVVTRPAPVDARADPPVHATATVDRSDPRLALGRPGAREALRQCVGGTVVSKRKVATVRTGGGGGAHRLVTEHWTKARVTATRRAAARALTCPHDKCRLGSTEPPGEASRLDVVGWVAPEAGDIWTSFAN